MPLFVTTLEGGKALHAGQKLVPAPRAEPDATGYRMVTVKALKIPPNGAVLWR